MNPYIDEDLQAIAEHARRFATDRRIDAGQKRGRHLNAPNTAHVSGSRESRQVAHNAAA